MHHLIYRRHSIYASVDQKKKKKKVFMQVATKAMG